MLDRIHSMKNFGHYRLIDLPLCGVYLKNTRKRSFSKNIILSLRAGRMYDRRRTFFILALITNTRMMLSKNMGHPPLNISHARSILVAYLFFSTDIFRCLRFDTRSRNETLYRTELSNYFIRHFFQSVV